ncbi:hypothetical protein OV208_12920 [Corallococcus sp. bb12-1]|uniref:hypothetical protein n=1 Tax=Corallococcus sp. bb12-1 TaxID=2996784 RepID=UPI00226EFD7D|nr:hypothetical protein [Corallococcus sp. bb12-1]MCY1042219.1 hypothetical protein [Corallococcus sp. bb12-1]
MDELCLHFHVVAVATLLVDGNPQGFFVNLCRAAENWRRLMVHLRREAIPIPASRSTVPLLGAAVSGHWELARQVAELAETRWCPEGEYRTEHAWAQVVHTLIAPGTKNALLPRIEELEAAEGETNSGLAACARALMDVDGESFTEAFRHAGQVHGEDVERRAKLFTTPVTRFAPRRAIWLEGLALLRLAERLGIAPHEEHFRYCPPLARLPMTETYRSDWVVSLAG